MITTITTIIDVRIHVALRWWGWKNWPSLSWKLPIPVLCNHQSVSSQKKDHSTFDHKIAAEKCNHTNSANLTTYVIISSWVECWTHTVILVNEWLPCTTVMEAGFTTMNNRGRTTTETINAWIAIHWPAVPPGQNTFITDWATQQHMAHKVIESSLTDDEDHFLNRIHRE